MDLKNIMAVTMGDPYGVGPEVIVKAINEEKKRDDILIVGAPWETVGQNEYVFCQFDSCSAN